MKKFKLPIIKEGSFSESRMLSMDDYLEFVQFNLKYTFDRKAYEEWKKASIVNVAFVLKEK